MTKKELQIVFSQKFPFLSEKDCGVLAEIGSFRSFKNKEQFVRLGQPSNAFYFILKGMIRGFYFSDSGQEHSGFLKPEFKFIAVPTALNKDAPTKYGLEAIGDAEVFEIPVEKFEELSFNHSGIARLYIEGLKENVLTLIFRVEMLTSKSPEERYEAMLKRYPHFFQKAYNKYIANYLGITPTSLSRIIRRKKSK